MSGEIAQQGVAALVVTVWQIGLGGVVRDLRLIGWGLAAILLVVAYNMGEWHLFATIARSPSSDLAVLFATFLLTVFVDLIHAIEIGMVLASFLFMPSALDSRMCSNLSDYGTKSSVLDFSFYHMSFLMFAHWEPIEWVLNGTWMGPEWAKYKFGMPTFVV